jgi:RNA polymerase sigma-70 factor (ECF subfamily)
VTAAGVSIDHVTDDDLVARARQGDAAAFGELVSRHQSAVHRAALSAGTPPADAGDVAQEAFLLAYRRLGSFRGEASFKTWLLRIAWNQAVNHRRARAGWWRRVVDDAAAGDQVATAAASPEELAHGAALRNDIRRAVKELPRKLRDAFLLAQSGEYSYEEIGAMLRAPVGTIKWRVSEARRLVRIALERRGYT